jgi:hypothetical protein
VKREETPISRFQFFQIKLEVREEHPDADHAAPVSSWASFPRLIIEAVIVRTQVARAVSQRTITVQNQCAILCDQLANLGYTSRIPSSEVVDARARHPDEYLRRPHHDRQPRLQE